jgi:hypothetical protein
VSENEDSWPTAVFGIATKANKAADKTLLESMAVLTEKIFVIHMCRDTIKKMESAKKRVSAENKVARRALVDDPTFAKRCPFLLVAFYFGTSGGRGYLYRFSRVLPSCFSTYICWYCTLRWVEFVERQIHQ